MSGPTLDAYISERVRKLAPTRTTTTASGQVLDWIAREGRSESPARPEAAGDIRPSVSHRQVRARIVPTSAVSPPLHPPR